MQEIINKDAFISFLDEEGKKREGIFLLLEIDPVFVKIMTDKNTIFIPTERILKIKIGCEKNDKDKLRL